jgi:DNA-binding CsgD family transcriptional regulator
VGDLVEAAVHSGRAAEARTIVEDLELPAELATSRWFPVGLCYAEVLLTDDVAVDAVVAEALAGELGRHPFMRARVQLEYGWRLRRLRRIAESRVPLLAACDLFDALGAHAWGERARRELRASGERSAARRPRPREQLTAQELQIARLAADGLSNREISDRLFLSPRTVGSHLYRLFPKLGIVSRTQLRDALGER